jgi:hypothetical protein
MKSLLFAVLTSTCLTSLMAQTAARSAICTLEARSILGHSATGVPDVSNLGSIPIRCSVPARPLPPNPGEFRNGLGAKAVAYEVKRGGSKQSVAAEAKVTGGGSDFEREYVNFDVLIPLRPADMDAEAHRFIAKFMEKAKASSSSAELVTPEAQQRMLKVVPEMIYQNRTGHFLLECHVMDGNETVAVGTVELEVLFKGRFSDYGLPGAPPA